MQWLVNQAYGKKLCERESNSRAGRTIFRGGWTIRVRDHNSHCRDGQTFMSDGEGGHSGLHLAMMLTNYLTIRRLFSNISLGNRRAHPTTSPAQA